jgi:transposase-like protein
MEHPAVVWYAKLLRLAPKRRDMTIPQLVLAAQRAAVLTSTERAEILADLASFQKGDLLCPDCGAGGPHPSNGHHRFYKLTFTCRACGSKFHSINH